MINEKKLSPKTKWLREAKWGLFTHYMVHMPSAPIPEDMTGDKWNDKVNSFDVKGLGDQLTDLKVKYFFITIGQAGNYYCSPNDAFERHFGPSQQKLTDRDLVMELADELTSRGIRMCVYLPAVGSEEKPEVQQQWQEVISEWSTRWGKMVHAWWIDGFVNTDTSVQKAFADAYRAGNPDALVAFNPGTPVGINRDQLMPFSEHEDYLAGECDYFLPTCGVRIFDGKEYYLGPDISGDQLHFLNFLGEWWSTGKPRFSDELVVSWTRHINDYEGAVTWDLPLQDNGIIPENYYKQVKALTEGI